MKTGARSFHVAPGGEQREFQRDPAVRQQHQQRQRRGASFPGSHQEDGIFSGTPEEMKRGQKAKREQNPPGTRKWEESGVFDALKHQSDSTLGAELVPGLRLRFSLRP